ncbi:MAG: glycine cleavage system protein H [Thermofilum sp. ex4484_79]|nr:MAG: glycine cleavage system protein H [Thermofilum sp. ex4484_79]
MPEDIVVKGYVVKKDLLYTDKHCWVKIEDGKAKIGITDYAQKKLGEIMNVELPSVGSEFNLGEAVATVEALKTVEDIYMPLSGKVIEVNERLSSEPELLNKSPYEDGWIATIEIKDESEVKKLLTPEKYSELIEKEE